MACALSSYRNSSPFSESAIQALQLPAYACSPADADPDPPMPRLTNRRVPLNPVPQDFPPFGSVCRHERAPGHRHRQALATNSRSSGRPRHSTNRSRSYHGKVDLLSHTGQNPSAKVTTSPKPTRRFYCRIWPASRHQHLDDLKGKDHHRDPAHRRHRLTAVAPRKRPSTLEDQTRLAAYLAGSRSDCERTVVRWRRANAPNGPALKVNCRTRRVRGRDQNEPALLENSTDRVSARLTEA